MPKKSLATLPQESAPPTRFEALRRLRVALAGQNLHDLAKLHGVTVQVNGKPNKGWVGMTVEKTGAFVGRTLPKKDGLDFELKSTSLVMRKGIYVPKETMQITMLSLKGIQNETFFKSVLWDKLQKLVVVTVVHKSKSECIVTSVRPLDVSDREMIDEIKTFWESIKEAVIRGEIGRYSSKGTSNGFIQLRTKGSKNQRVVDPVTEERIRPRAFYATKEFLKYFLGVI